MKPDTQTSDFSPDSKTDTPGIGASAEPRRRQRMPVRIVPKGLGREVWLVNNDLYCGKILEISKGKLP